MVLLFRREFLAALSLAGLTHALGADRRRPQRCLVHLGLFNAAWGGYFRQASALCWLRQTSPHLELTLWLQQPDPSALAFLAEHFPNLPHLSLALETNGTVGTEMKKCLQRHDSLIHLGQLSSSSQAHLAAWQASGKPSVLLDFSSRMWGDGVQKCLKAATAIFCTESESQRQAAKLASVAQKTHFLPETTFGFHLGSARKAAAMRARAKAANKPYLFLHTGLRHSPAWEIFHREPKGAEIIQEKENQAAEPEDWKRLAILINALARSGTQRLIVYAEQECLRQRYTAKLLPLLDRDGLEMTCIYPETLPPDALFLSLQRADALLSTDAYLAMLGIAAQSPTLWLGLSAQPEALAAWRDAGFADYFLHWQGDVFPAVENLLRRRLEIRQDLKKHALRLQGIRDTAAQWLRKERILSPLP